MLLKGSRKSCLNLRKIYFSGIFKKQNFNQNILSRVSHNRFTTDSIYQKINSSVTINSSDFQNKSLSEKLANFSLSNSNKHNVKHLDAPIEVFLFFNELKLYENALLSASIENFDEITAKFILSTKDIKFTNYENMIELYNGTNRLDNILILLSLAQYQYKCINYSEELLQYIDFISKLAINRNEDFYQNTIENTKTIHKIQEISLKLFPSDRNPLYYNFHENNVKLFTRIYSQYNFMKNISFSSEYIESIFYNLINSQENSLIMAVK